MLSSLHTTSDYASSQGGQLEELSDTSEETAAAIVPDENKEGIYSRVPVVCVARKDDGNRTSGLV